MRKLLAVLALCYLPSDESVAATHRFARPEFAIDLPGCYETRQLSRADLQAGRLATLAPTDPSAASCPAELVILTDLGGVIGREPIAAEHLRPGGRTGTMPWGEFELVTIRTPGEGKARGLVQIDVQVPLKPALQVSFLFAADREANVTALAAEAIESIRGDSNWLTGKERAARAGEGFGRLIVVVGAVLLVVYWVRSKRRRKPRFYDGRARHP